MLALPASPKQDVDGMKDKTELTSKLHRAASTRLWRPATSVLSALLLLVYLFSTGQVQAQQKQAQQDQNRFVRVELGAHSGPVRRIDVSERFSLVATASDDKTVRIWDYRAGTLRHVLRPQVGSDETGRMYGVAIHPSEDLIAVGGTTGGPDRGHQILLFQLTTGRLLSAIDARAGHVKDLRWAGDGRLIFAIYDGSHGVRAFNRAGKLVYEERFSAPSYGLDTGRTGQLAVAAYDGQIRLYQSNGETVRPLKTFASQFPYPRSVAFSPDDRLLAVGYRGSRKDQGAPTIYDANTGAQVLQIEKPDSGLGDMRAVSWSGNGNQLIAGGSRYTTEGEHALYVFDARNGEFISKTIVAGNSITDLIQTSSQSIYASFDGTWGTIQNQHVMLSVGGNLPDFRGPENLRISADASKISVSFANGEKPAWFDVSDRQLILGSPPGDLETPKIKNGFFDSSEWQNTRQPKIFGESIPMLGAEISRSIAYLPQKAGALLGTSKRFKRLNTDGQVIWDVFAPGEVWAINISENGKVAVTTQSDGTVRWWTTADGKNFLSMFLMAQGRWVIWTADGFFDADIGADRLAGWAVNRYDAPLSDYFSLNRFREKYNRPDKIHEALTVALDQHRFRSTENATDGQPVSAEPAPLPTPPVVELGSLATPVLANQQVSIPVSVRSDAAASLELRIDGRPVGNATASSQATSGQPITTLSVPAPEPGSTIQVIAKNAAGASEPLSFQVPVIKPVNSNVIQAAALTPVPAVPPAVVTGVAAEQTAALAIVEAAAQRAARPAGDKPRLFILAIGVSDYQRQEYRLELAAKDASDFSTVFTSQPNEFYSQINSRLLVNQDASRQGIEQGLAWLRESVTEKDVGIVFLAGHGLNAADGRYYYLPWDGKHESLSTTSVPESTLRNTLGTIKGKALLFVDTCHAGRAIGLFSTAKRELTRLANDLAAAENGVIVFASSTAGQLSEESDVWQNGAFTKALVDGLLGNADFRSTGRVTYKGLDFFVSSEVSKLTETRQTPVTISPVGLPDFSLTKVVARR